MSGWDRFPVFGAGSPALGSSLYPAMLAHLPSHSFL